MPLDLIWVFFAGLAGGAVNSIAGGGTLLTFPVLVGVGIPAIVANASNTVALSPGALSSVWGYRGELAGIRPWAVGLAAPSVLGGFLGALLLLVTPSDRFDVIVPWLVFGATALFMAQRPVMRWMANKTGGTGGTGGTGATGMTVRPTAAVIGYQLLVGVYGGYFGAGIGILMLAALGFMGFTNIHRMNGLKNFLAVAINGTASVTFIIKDVVDWPIAVATGLGAVLGGYVGARLAQRVSQERVRQAIAVVGLSAGVWLLVGR
jgi:uncharacterized membrane protein YfcA